MPAPLNSLPPPQPKYIFRGHSSQIHALGFSPDNSSLLTGDANGWIVCWNLAVKRPIAAWKAHESAVLRVAWWGASSVISHGRDSKLVVWNLGKEAVEHLDKTLPVEVEKGSAEERAKTGGEGKAESTKPKILHELILNTLNFCAFAWCWDLDVDEKLLSPEEDGLSTSILINGKDQADGRPPIFLAVPHTLDSEAIDIYHLPSTNRLSVIPAVSAPNTGMAMALALVQSKLISSDAILVAAGYESGHVMVFAQIPHSSSVSTVDSATRYSGQWQRLYMSNPHTQPILSLAGAPDASYFLTSSADDVIAKHPFISLLGHISTGQDGQTILISTLGMVTKPLNQLRTKHAGQQGLSIRSDALIFSTAGWDGRVRVYSSLRNTRELAVLKWHKEGCYTTSFAMVKFEANDGASDWDRRGNQVETSGSGDLLKAQNEGTRLIGIGRSRSDDESAGKKFMNAAPDEGSQIYDDASPAEGKREVVAQNHTDLETGQRHRLVQVLQESESRGDCDKTTNRSRASDSSITSSAGALETVASRRERKVRDTHWLAAGSKDGKISLWEIY